MCAIIGIVLKAPSKDDHEMIRRIFVESKIRGLHATGISFLPKWSKGIETMKEPVPADVFFDKFIKGNIPDMLAPNGNLYMIGHCRYSTSDLEYNQPLFSQTKSIVHNGVITQESPDKWQELYGHECITKNDSELVLHSADPLREYSHMSMSVCELHSNRTFRFYRNGKRPNYFTRLTNGYIITSTADIATRAGLGDASQTPMNTYMQINDPSLAIMSEKVTIEADDLQKVDYV